MTVRIGMFGTSWWADTMYLPPASSHPAAEVVAVTGRREATTKSFAETWDIPQWFTDPQRMIDEAELDAVIIATSNDTHYDLAMASLKAGLHVLCEKPLALDRSQAEAMAELAAASGAITLVPFTYHYMPVNRWVRQLVADGYVGRPLHVNLRYYTDFGFDTAYSWRFDKDIAGTGIIGDLGSHIVHLARWLIDEEETSVSAVTHRFIERGQRPDGSAYEPLEDTAVMTIRYRSGAIGVLHTSAACWEGESEFGQLHEFDIHGDAGTLRARCDWETVQEVTGSRLGEPIPQLLPIPDEVWGDLRRGSVGDTYRDVFRTTSAMTRAWVEAVAAGEPIQPDMAEGLAVQRVLDAAVASGAAGGSPVAIEQAVDR